MITPADLSIDDIFYECQSGFNIKAKVLTQPTYEIVTIANKDRKQWSWKALNVTTNIIIDYTWTEGLSSTYGPRIYSEPQYCRFENGQVIFTFE